MSEVQSKLWQDDVLDFVASFATIKRSVNGETIRLCRGDGDLMHTLGYYVEQNRGRLKDMTLADRLRLVADTISHIADHLAEDDD